MPIDIAIPADGPGSDAWHAAWESECERRAEALDLMCYCRGDQGCRNCDAAESLGEQVWDEMFAAWDAASEKKAA